MFQAVGAKINVFLLKIVPNMTITGTLTITATHGARLNLVLSLAE